jgi:ADP-heptose:LPS heptosyltransferase
VINLEGDIPLGLLPATVALGALYIGSDTGTMHLASAAGVPVFEVSCHPMDGDAYWA